MKSSKVTKPCRSPEEIAAARQKLKAAREAAAANRKAIAEAKKIAKAAAKEAAAQKHREKEEAENKAFAELWSSIVVEELQDGSVSITDDERSEAQGIVRRFITALTIGRYNITKLERLYNARLEERFAAAKEIYRSRHKRSYYETVMFHGTGDPNVDK